MSSQHRPELDQLWRTLEISAKHPQHGQALSPRDLKYMRAFASA